MTRKCILCKETNYKNSFSFFSAPKDAETRRKWQEAIGIEDYVVNDETFVCSKHFTPADIITHWVSGVPPSVITIKYKKCRLRPGAVPNASLNIMNNGQDNQDDEFEFEVNRHWGNDRKMTTFSHEKEVFLIPRADNISTYTNIENQNNSTINSQDIDDDNADIEEYLTKTMVPKGDPRNAENMEEMILDSQQQHQDLVALESDGGDDEHTVYLKTNDVNDESILYVENLEYTDDCTEESVKETLQTTKEITEECPSTIISQVTNDEEEAEGIEDESLEVWETVKTETISNQDSEDKISRTYEDVSMDVVDNFDASENEDTMLFEDLLEVYTEVRLPRGWSSMVIPAGRGTTVIYARMNMAQSSVPYVEKQVFLKSDMTLQCSAMGNALNPRLHNLLREGRQLKVHTLLDVEEFIDEFDQRIVCEGTLEKELPADLDSILAYRHDSKWRHIDCPIIINNGTSRCSKCSTLNSQINRRKIRKPPQTAESAELLKKERTIYVLQKLLAKMSKRNQRYESIKNNLKSISGIIESLNIPDIQKIMIKECLGGDSNNEPRTITETWIFLSLLIYIESPKVYKFLLLNKFMNLPEIKIMRRYLHQITTDDQFYKLFQQTVEPFRCYEREEKNVPT